LTKSIFRLILVGECRQEGVAMEGRWTLEQVERFLAEEYAQALLYYRRYGVGREYAEALYRKLQGVREALARRAHVHEGVLTA
jgi:hypothetical protein